MSSHPPKAAVIVAGCSRNHSSKGPRRAGNRGAARAAARRRSGRRRGGGVSDLTIGSVGGKREATKLANRAAIVAAAREVFADIGFGAASVRDIIRRTDLATGTFYNYFPDKESVLVEILDETAAEIRVRVRAARRGAATIEDFVRSGFEAYFRYLAEDPLTLELLRRNAGTIRAMFDEPSVGAGTEELRDDLEAGIASGLFPPHDSRLMAAAMIGAGFEVGIRILDRGEPDVEAAVALVTTIFVAGLERLAALTRDGLGRRRAFIHSRRCRLSAATTASSRAAPCAHASGGERAARRRRPHALRRASRSVPAGPRQRAAQGAAAPPTASSCAAWRAPRRTASRAISRRACAHAPTRCCWPTSSRSPRRGWPSSAARRRACFGEAARLAAAGRREDALWLLAQIAAIGPPSRTPTAIPTRSRRSPPRRCPGRPRSSRRGRPTQRGPRGSSDLGGTLRAYRAWAARGGGQAAALAGEASWSPARRFERAFERLALPGFARGARYDFLLTVGALGLADVRPASLQLLADQRDPVLAAAKRVFAFGDPIVLERRAAELASAAALPLGALDLGLLNWARRTDDPAPPRITPARAPRPTPTSARSWSRRSARAARRTARDDEVAGAEPVN